MFKERKSYTVTVRLSHLANEFGYSNNLLLISYILLFFLNRLPAGVTSLLLAFDCDNS